MLRPELKIPDVHPINAKHIVIAGAGPVGLVATIILARQGIEVTLVDKWIGKCTRAHEVHIESIKKIAEAIHPLEIFVQPDVTFTQFKDIEKQLFEHVKTLERKNPSKIHLIEKQFHSFRPKRKILLRNEEGLEETIENVDMFFDCTGEYRAGLKNDDEQQLDKTLPQFVTKPLTSNQEVCLFGKMRLLGNENPFITFNFPIKPTNYSSYFSLRKNLEELGWKEARLPETHAMIRPKKNSSLYKGHVYMELPKEFIGDKKIITEAYLKSYAKILFKLTTAEDINIVLQPTKKPNKAMYSTFVSNPQKTELAFKQEDENFPFRAHFGDSSCSVLFLTASGLSRGISETMDSLKFIKVKNGIIETIELKKWHDYYQKNLEDAKLITELTYSGIIKEKNEKIADFKQICFNAYMEADDKARELVIKDYQKVDPLVPLPRIALEKILSSIDKITILNSAVSLEKTMQNVDIETRYLNKICIINPLSEENRKKIETAWRQLAFIYNNVGLAFQDQKQITISSECLQKSLKIHEEHLKNRFRDKVKVCCNLAATLLEKQDYQALLDVSNKAIGDFIFLEHHSQNTVIMELLSFYKTSALLNIAIKLLAKKPLITEKISSLLTEAKALIPNIAINKQRAFLHEYRKLKKKMRTLNISSSETEIPKVFSKLQLL